jgi:hypothetical protein
MWMNPVLLDWISDIHRDGMTISTAVTAKRELVRLSISTEREVFNNLHLFTTRKIIIDFTPYIGDFPIVILPVHQFFRA